MNINERLQPLIERLRNPFNIIMIVIGILLVIDLVNGSPFTRWLIRFQYSLKGLEPKDDYTIHMVTVFGTFTDIRVLAALLDKVLIGASFTFAGLSLLRGLAGSVLGK